MMFKMPVGVRRCLAGLAASLLLIWAPAGSAQSREKDRVSALVIAASDGAVLYEKMADRVRPPASLTKMMTLYLAFDALEDGRLKLGDTIIMSRHAARQPASKLGLPAGKSLTVKMALSAIAVHSANDVAVAVAEKLEGSEVKFVRRMTEKAQQLGMSHTQFSNATGLTNSGNRTTARDMGTLSIALLKRHPREYAYFATRSIVWKSQTLANHNHLLGKVVGVDGIKTGYTADAGYNLAASAKRGDRRIVAIVLGEHTAAARDLRIANLVELGFSALPGAIGRPATSLAPCRRAVPPTHLVRSKDRTSPPAKQRTDLPSRGDSCPS